MKGDQQLVERKGMTYDLEGLTDQQMDELIPQLKPHDRITWKTDFYATRFNVRKAEYDKIHPLEEKVNHPQHYIFGKYEVLDVLLDWFPQEPLLWQVGKYIARCNHKGSCLEDLKKAQFYLARRIQLEEEKA